MVKDHTYKKKYDKKCNRQRSEDNEIILITVEVGDKS